MENWKTVAEPLFYTIEETVKVSGLSRTAIYDALKRGDLKARKSGRRTLLRRTELVDYLDALPAWQPKA